MRWSIRRTLILGGGVVMGTFAIAAFLAYQEARLVTRYCARWAT